MADSHDNQQNIIDKAKEINKKIREKQANSKKNISSEINDEEPLPLNDPFVGDSSLSGGNTIMANNSEEAQNEMSLYKFKLVGIIEGEYEAYVTLVDASGEILSLTLHEELSEGVKLIDLRINEAIFEKDDNTYISINFKNQIKEMNEY